MPQRTIQGVFEEEVPAGLLMCLPLDFQKMISFVMEGKEVDSNQYLLSDGIPCSQDVQDALSDHAAGDIANPQIRFIIPLFGDIKLTYEYQQVGGTWWNYGADGTYGPTDQPVDDVIIPPDDVVVP